MSPELYIVTPHYAGDGKHEYTVRHVTTTQIHSSSLLYRTQTKGSNSDIQRETLDTEGDNGVQGSPDVTNVTGRERQTK